MARIRTIKPEFVESESVGKLTREARLLFILLWTFVDDAGRARASSRLLASRLYPYDDDAPKKIGGWLEELQLGQHIRIYEVDGDQYLDIPKWLKHQKIDHASASRLPEFRETSRGLAKDCETIAPHTLDLGPVPRTLDQDNSTAAKPGADKRGTRLTDDWQLTPELRAFAIDHGLDPDGLRDEFADYWTSVPGSKGLKLDWSKTFKNRCRELSKKPTFARGRAAPTETFDQRRIREAMEAISDDRH